MTELAKSMFSYAWAMSLFGMQKMVDALGPVETSPGGNAKKGASASPLSMLDMLGPFNPAYWLNLGSEHLLKQGQQSASAQHPQLASVLDLQPSPLLDLPPEPPTRRQAATPLRAQGNGWGPMP